MKYYTGHLYFCFLQNNFIVVSGQPIFIQVSSKVIAKGVSGLPDMGMPGISAAIPVSSSTSRVKVLSTNSRGSFSLNQLTIPSIFVSKALPARPPIEWQWIL